MCVPNAPSGSNYGTVVKYPFDIFGCEMWLLLLERRVPTAWAL